MLQLIYRSFLDNLNYPKFILIFKSIIFQRLLFSKVLSPVDTSKVTTLIIMFNAPIDFDQISMNVKSEKKFK
ncbi:hypothetical protein GLOIN_2v1572347 [Rhizophagus irregularis DAOM 181602=DAOM 197198]|uniref:Uncharacterized protein n=1 Tax=Rhizophagus irregularis (strain DAOM 181602 / DAOM 197198 / MUCL 43194) TaxID=747089 RepID=A0A2P4QB67_RHIID|nr:hypothetical protein GLOIN_2v1572347 [Rhizophagus irregularis DAOM 181602=DAOM 197198]POG74884.1 hypothetical protein GLOIN_2v1572347 [Rhizophagus irregularis DAOM 181602=DAOM 197198]GET53911.1 hypothetical protein GLOIN_2v1572347 [Rhizophagus irregularis DAOM 181602=DAOM 197198]|eukprot:XP_025181750.1 hypothetical protein GLOIN_2v1572347 [Rhizophagus irregularis DAOM 181602=DAOM 197198]